MGTSTRIGALVVAVVVVALQVTESESSFRKESTSSLRGPDSVNRTEVDPGTGRVKRDGYHHQQQHYKPHKRCYQCAYSPPKKVYEVGYEVYGYGSYGGHGGGGSGGHDGGYGGHGGGSGGHGGGYGGHGGGSGGHGGGYGGHGGEGYEHHSVHKQPVVLHGGWDKCLGPFDHYQAKAHGIDTWDCHYGNCYVRRDHNGDVFRGCYKGEYGVDQNKFGCHHQGGYGYAGSVYCFCYGELCNNGPAPYGGH